MREASSRLEFERAAHLRDQIAALKNPLATQPMRSVKYPTAKSGRKPRVSS
jgi:excinuclease UvrABC nuclease subunit